MGAADPRHPNEASDDSGEYRIAPDETPSATPAAKAKAEAKPADETSIIVARRRSLVDDDSVDEDAPATDDDGDDLPPPISAEANPKPWLVAGGAALGFVLLAWLAGVDSLAIPIPTSTGTVVPELELGDRIGGFIRTLVFFPLATLAAAFGMLGLAFIDQRPVGDVGALFAKCGAVVAFALVLWLVPIDIRFVKQVVNTLGVPLVAGAIAVPVFRLTPRDAAVATGLALLGMALLVLGSLTVVWAVGR
jgi:hypothetical protein